MPKNVVLFSQPGWLFCNRVKEFLHQQKVAFTDRDITKDATALADLEAIGVMTTPVILVNGNTIVGYDIATHVCAGPFGEIACVQPWTKDQTFRVYRRYFRARSLVAADLRRAFDRCRRRFSVGSTVVAIGGLISSELESPHRDTTFRILLAAVCIGAGAKLLPLLWLSFTRPGGGSTKV